MIGKVLGNRYEVLEKIGTGGMGDVYKAHCRKLDRIVAIKVLKQEYNDDNNFIRKFKRESLAAASISHPNIVSIYDVGSEDFGGDVVHYIVMEYIDGKTLKEVISEEGCLNEKRALNYCVQIAEALKVAHSKNIVHRDIKSQNIMVTKDDRVKVTDFGIARVADNSTVTATNAIMGSVHYFSPEQARGAKVDNRSDIYSLGIVLYEMLTGKLPFDAENPVSVALMQVQSNMPKPSDSVRGISEATDAIVLKMTMKDPDDRYSDVYQLIKDIKNIQLGRTSSIDYTQTMKTAIPLDERIKESNQNLMKNKNNSVSNRRKKVVRRNQDKDEIYEEEKEVKKPKKKKKSMTPVFLGMLTAVLLFVCIIYIVPKALFNHNSDAQVEATMIKVPDLKGETEESAKVILEAQKLKMNIADVEENGNYKNNEIISQSPEKGEQVEEGSTVNVVINRLPDSIKVPDLTNKTLEDAQDIIAGLGLRITKIDNEYSDDIQEGNVISQDPVAGSEVIKDKDIKIVVSKGKDTTEKTIENTTGISEKDAQSTLEEAGFKVKVVKKSNNTVGVGEVFDYEPRGTAPKGSTITIYVRSNDDSEDISDKTDNSQPADNNNNNEKQSTNLNVRVPDDGERHNVVVKRFLPNGKNFTLYNYHKTSSDGDIQIPVEGKKGDRIELYIDDSLVQSKHF